MTPDHGTPPTGAARWTRGSRPALGPRARGVALLLLVLGGLLAAGGDSEAQATAPGSSSVAPGFVHSFPPWAEHNEATENALRAGAIIERSRVGTGVTNPWKVTLDHQGTRLVAVWKPLIEDPHALHRESWRAEVAAYRLSRYLGLDMVPPTVARTIEGEEGSLQLWVDDCQRYRDVPKELQRPGYRWLNQIDRMRLFDAFLDNGDRNAGNFLVDEDWHIVLIDHSRALPLRKRPQKMPPLSKRIDRTLLDRVSALEPESLRLLIGDLYSKFELAVILRHRDRLLREIEKAVRRGNAAYVVGESLLQGADGDSGGERAAG